jgi:cytochrome P450
MRNTKQDESADLVAAHSAGPRDTPDGGGCPVWHGYDPLSPEELADPYPSFAQARRKAPVFYSPALDTWSVANHSDVLAILKDVDNFSSRAALPIPDPPRELRDRLPEYPWAHSLLTMDDPDHRPARAAIQKPFTPRRVAQLEAGIRTRATGLLDSLADSGSIEFVGEYAYPLSLSVIGELLGIPPSRLALLQTAVTGAFRILGEGLTNRDDVLAVSRNIADLVEYMNQLVEEKRRSPGEDFTSAMAASPRADGSAPATDELVRNVWVIIAAGFETSANVIALGVRSLLAHPDQWQLLLNDRTLVDNAVEEMLRYRTLVKRIYRSANREVTVDGVSIPAGARVSLLTASANRDPGGYADDPDRFDVSRKREHLAFGRWKHFCVGAPLARLEMRITLATLLERFPDVTVDEREALRWKRDVRMDVLERLVLRLPSQPTRA